MNITIREDLRSFIEPLTADEYAALERSLLEEGCRDALVLWNDVLVDGHNRYAICQKHGIAFQTVQNTRFASLDDVRLWMINNHLGRRSVSEFQRGVLALRKKEILAAQATPEQPAPRLKRSDLAREARVSPALIASIEKIEKAATPELVEAVRKGTISINAAATVAALPPAHQQAAVAGGRKQLQEAARSLRAQRLASRPAAEPAPPPPAPAMAAAREDSASASTSVPWETDTLDSLRQRIASLEAENQALKAELAALRAP
ncbi:hypothetical protein [Massilia sp. TS11]|uniref:hypothetical protein n=1 Tax=Massilia sp. TS11 TaxID=2908003 RepID=UPI001ED9C8DD|nr:hypothetical protein [Massilia sp. TS11]MCG2584535.1 hypothetical protein [Massilia sp. TS11]